MVTTFNSNSKLKTKLETLQQLPSNYINFNNVLVNSSVMNGEEEDKFDECGGDEEPVDHDEDNTSPAITFSTRKNPTKHFNFDKKILYEDVIQVNCNSIVAELYKKKFGSGGKGRCIRVEADNSQGDKSEKWMTPIEFETYCGKGNCRDWKRTLKAGGQQILAILDAGILTCHAVSCSCAVCNQNESLVGPIKPFMRYRRRKKDEILAQNAYKKFLSLKPPTLLGDLSFNSPQNSNSPVQKIFSSNSLKLNNSNQSLSKVTSSTNNVSSSSLSVNTNMDDLVRFINKIQENDDKKWAGLELMAQEMINQAKNLQSQIEIQRKESEVNRKLLIEKLFQASNQQCMSSSSSSSTSSLNQSNRKRKLTNTQQYSESYDYTYDQEYDECYEDDEEDENVTGFENEDEDIEQNQQDEQQNDENQSLEHPTDDEDFFKEKKVKYF